MLKKSLIGFILGCCLMPIESAMAMGNEEKFNAQIVNNNVNDFAYFVDENTGSYGFYNNLKHPMIFTLKVSPSSQGAVVLKCMHYVDDHFDSIKEAPTEVHKVKPGESYECTTKNMVVFNIDNKAGTEHNKFAVGTYTIMEAEEKADVVSLSFARVLYQRSGK